VLHILFKKIVGLVNYYSLVNCYAIGPTDQYSVLIFCTKFDIILLELVRFWNSRYSISSCSFSCPVLPLSLSFSYSNVEVENGWEVFLPFSSLPVSLSRRMWTRVAVKAHTWAVVGSHWPGWGDGCQASQVARDAGRGVPAKRSSLMWGGAKGDASMAGTFFIHPLGDVIWTQISRWRFQRWRWVMLYPNESKTNNVARCWLYQNLPWIYKYNNIVVSPPMTHVVSLISSLVFMHKLALNYSLLLFALFPTFLFLPLVADIYYTWS
jgi:hypothetical protein